MLLFLGKDFERMHQVLLQLVVKPDILDKCVSVVDLLKINLSNLDTYLKVKNIHFGFLTEDQCRSYYIKIKLHVQMLKVTRSKLAVWLLLWLKK